MGKYYDDVPYEIAFERCIDVMARLIMKYGPELLAEMSTDATPSKNDGNVIELASYRAPEEDSLEEAA